MKKHLHRLSVFFVLSTLNVACFAFSADKPRSPSPATKMPSVAADGSLLLTCDNAKDIMQMFLISHYNQRNFTEELKDRTVEQFIKFLDPTKALLIHPEVAEIRRAARTLFQTMAFGSCQQLTNAKALLVKRALENQNFIAKFLDDKYKLDQNVELVLDPDKREFPKSSEEKFEYLKKFAHFQISNYVTGDVSLPEARKKLQHRYELITKRISERTEIHYLEFFIKAFASSLDPHTGYLSLDDTEDFKIDMGLQLTGIGASLSSQDGFTVVEEIIPGGAADRAKTVKPKDKIVAVSNAKGEMVDVIDMDLPDVVKMIRGTRYSKVTLTIIREENGIQRLSVALTRDLVKLKDQQAKMKIETRKTASKTQKFAVIDLPGFYGDGEKASSYEDMKELVEKAAQAKVDGILINLMRNGGGLLEDAIRISGLFIKEGNIVAVQNAAKKVVPLADTDSDIAWGGPLVILTSRYSASASEIMAGALRDYKRALVVGGDHTFGKGTVQNVISLRPNLGSLKVTIQMFFIPGGDSTQGQGVASNVVLPSTLNRDDIGEKTLDYSLPPAKVTPFLSPEANGESHGHKLWQPIDDGVVSKLAQFSADRVKKDPKFAEIYQDIEENKKDTKVLKLAEVFKKSVERKAKNKADEKKTAVQRQSEAEAPYINEGLNILQDLVNAQSAVPVVSNKARTTSAAKTN